MKRKIPHPKRLIDVGKLRADLAELAGAHAGDAAGLRGAVLAALKPVVAQARAEAEHRLVNGARGIECARLLSWFQDQLLRELYEFTISHVYLATNPSTSERISLVAIGGYGRGLLAPGSDIDLLFLFPYKQTAWGESVSEYILYLLWDLGFKVGHATRNVNECIRLSLEDITIRTSILEARHLWGDKALFDELMQRFQAEILDKHRRAFVEAKLEERDQRHRRRDKSRYVVEPNLKEGKGGLRDLHTLAWIVRVYYGVSDYGELVVRGVLTGEEARLFHKCEGFLWAVRCHLHFMTGRAEERLGFEVQPALAERLGYTDRGRLKATERFMKHYFLTAKSVGDLTRIICAALEFEQVKTTPGLSRFLKSFRLPGRNKLKHPGFVIESGRLAVASEDIFSEDPVNLIRCFHIADQHNLLLHPQAVRLIARSLKLIGADLRRNKEANRLFLDILTSRNDPETILRKMNETGVLGRFIYAFGRIVALMQFNMYHHYTVDEHLLRAVGVLSEIERGLLAEEHPLSHRLIGMIQNRRALFLAVFTHDIAKGLPESHSAGGARIARRLGPRLGLSPAETDTAAWLVENHLLMSQVAQERDVHDFKTIQSFVRKVQSPERLRLLLILTVADIKAVGPGVWNGWKGQLLRTLYYEAEPQMGGVIDQLSRRERAERAREKLTEQLTDWPEALKQNITGVHYPPYLLNVPLNKQVAHAHMMRDAMESGRAVASEVHTDAFQGVTELTVFTADHPHLLSVFTGACAACGADISGAQVFTTSSGFALDIITLYRQFDQDRDEIRRAGRITELIEQVLRGEKQIQQLVSRKKPIRHKVRPFSVEPQVFIDNESSNLFTVIEVNGLDRTGLLFALTEALFDVNLNIGSARITTYGEKVVDVFYVKDSFGHKITNPRKIKAVRTRLLEALRVPGRAKADKTAA